MKSQTRKILLLLAEAFFYCLGGVALFQILWFFIQDLFSTDHAFLYFLPYYLSCLLPAYLVVILHKIRHPTSEIGKKRWMKVNSRMAWMLLFWMLLRVIMRRKPMRKVT